MTDAVAAGTTVPVASTSAKLAAKKVGAAKRPASKRTYPPTVEMVDAAMAALLEKKGFSCQAIQKYIAGTYIDVQKQLIFIKKRLKSAAVKKAAAKSKTAKPVKAKAPTTVKKNGKTPAAKPKTPKTRKTAAPKVKQAKK